MSDDRGIIRIPVSFEHGVLETQEKSRLPPGFSPRIENWVPEPTGELRVRPTWTPSPLTIPVGAMYSSRNVFGIGHYAWNGASSFLAAQLGTSTSMRFMAGRDPLYLGTAGFWTDVGNVTIPAASASGDSSPVAFATGLGRTWFTRDGFPSLYSFDSGGVFAAVAGSPADARAVSFHGTRIFAGGSTANPYRLFYSVIGNGADWAGAGSGNIDVGQDDGEPIEDLASFNDDLLVIKQSTVWLLTGDGPTTFALHKLPDAGGRRGRSATVTPYGVLIAGDDQIWLYNSDVPTRIGDQIIESWVQSNTRVTFTSGAFTGYVNPGVWGAYFRGKCYLSAPVTGQVFVFDFGSQSWTTESGPETVGPLYATKSALYMAPIGGAVGSFIQYRQGLAGERKADYVGQDFFAETPEIWPEGPIRPFVAREVELQLRARSTGGASGLPLTLTPYVDGAVQTPYTIPDATQDGVYRVRIPIPGVDGYSIRFTLEQTVPSAGGPLYDVEDFVVGVTPAGAR